MNTAEIFALRKHFLLLLFSVFKCKSSFCECSVNEWQFWGHFTLCVTTIVNLAGHVMDDYEGEI